MAKRSSHAARFFKIVTYLLFHAVMILGLLAILLSKTTNAAFFWFYVLAWYIINYVFFSNRDPADFDDRH